jgi:hypothetical protein
MPVPAKEKNAALRLRRRFHKRKILPPVQEGMFGVRDDCQEVRMERHCLDDL